MGDDISGGKSWFAAGLFYLFESVALGFALEAISDINHGVDWHKSALFLLIAFATGCVGFWIKSRSTFDASWILKTALLIGSGLCAAGLVWLSIGKQGASIIVAVLLCFYVVIPSCFYIIRLRRDLDTYVMPRVLSKKQVSDVQRYLLKHEAHALTLKIVPNDEEATQYGHQLFLALRETNWTVNMAQGSLDMRQGLHIHEEGLKITPQNPKNDPREILWKAFQEAQVPINGGMNVGGRSEYKISILIGKRPFALPMKPPILARLGQWIHMLGYKTHMRALSALGWPVDSLAWSRRALSARRVRIAFSRRVLFRLFNQFIQSFL